MSDELTIKQVAEMKKAFLESDFGKFVAQKITVIHGDLHEKAENESDRDKRVSYLDRAVGVTEVIRFFTADVALLDQGYFDEKKEDGPKAP